MLNRARRITEDRDARDPLGVARRGRRDDPDDDAGMFEAALPPVLVGHSAGAQHAVRAAIAHDDRLLGVIAVLGVLV